MVSGCWHSQRGACISVTRTGYSVAYPFYELHFNFGTSMIVDSNKLFPLFAIQVLRWKGNILIAPCSLKISSSRRRVVSFTPQPPIFRRKVSRYSLHRGLDGAQSRCGRVIEHYPASTGNQTTIP